MSTMDPHLNSPEPFSRSPSPSPPPSLASDEGQDTADEYDEGAFDLDDDSTQLIGAVKEIYSRLDRSSPTEQGSPRLSNRGASVPVVTPVSPNLLASSGILLGDFANSLDKRVHSSPDEALGIAKQARGALKRGFKRLTTLLSSLLLPRASAVPRKLSDFPPLSAASSIRSPPPFPPVSLPRPALKKGPQPLTELALAIHNAPAAPGGGGDDDGGGGGDPVNISTDSGSTDTCPGEEDLQAMFNIGECLLALEDLLLRGQPSKDKRSSTSVSILPQLLPIATYDLSTKTLETAKGLVATSTVEAIKGVGQTFHHNFDSLSFYVPHLGLPAALLSRSPQARHTYALVHSRTSADRESPGHATATRSKYEFFVLNASALVTVETRCKVQIGRLGTLHHTIYFDPKYIDVESVRVAFENSGFTQGKVLRGIGHSKAIIVKVSRWKKSLAAEIKQAIRSIETSLSLNPFFSSSSPLVTASDTIIPSKKFPINPSLSPSSPSACSNVGRLVIYHDFSQILLMEWPTLAGPDKAILGEVQLTNAAQQQVLIRQAFGVFRDLSQLHTTFSELTGQTWSEASTFGTNISLPRSFSSTHRKLQHKTMFYHAAEIVQSLGRQGICTAGEVLYAASAIWTDTGACEFRLTTIPVLDSNISSLFITGGNGFLQVRAGLKVDFHQGMKLSSVDSPSKRHSKQMGRGADNDFRARDLVAKWRPMFAGGSAKLPLHNRTPQDPYPTFSFNLPYSASIALQLGLPEAQTQIVLSFSNRDLPDGGGLGFGRRLGQLASPPRNVTLYCNDNGEMTFSIDDSTNLHLFDTSTLTAHSASLADFAKWRIFLDVDEGRLRGLPRLALPSVVIRQKFDEAKMAYQLAGAGKRVAQQEAFENPSESFKGFPICLQGASLTNLPDLSQRINRVSVFNFTSAYKLRLLGHDNCSKSRPPPTTLYHVYLGDDGNTRITGTTPTRKIDELGTRIWSNAKEAEFLKAIEQARSVYEEEGDLKRKRLS